MIIPIANINEVPMTIKGGYPMNILMLIAIAQASSSNRMIDAQDAQMEQQEAAEFIKDLLGLATQNGDPHAIYAEIQRLLTIFGGKTNLTNGEKDALAQLQQLGNTIKPLIDKYDQLNNEIQKQTGDLKNELKAKQGLVTFFAILVAAYVAGGPAGGAIALAVLLSLPQYKPLYDLLVKTLSSGMGVKIKNVGDFIALFAKMFGNIGDLLGKLVSDTQSELNNLLKNGPAELKAVMTSILFAMQKTKDTMNMQSAEMKAEAQSELKYLNSEYCSIFNAAIPNTNN
ncbi:MAG: hypothetical protein HZB76_06180 [Chlamydiae bacterium]|nr:hypothetical protein [Chlamydiota bacterium]